MTIGGSAADLVLVGGKIRTPAHPSSGDAHVHPVQGGLERLRCDLTGMRTRRVRLGGGEPARNRSG